MGHRALVAYRDPDGTVDLHYAHWGRNLADHITPATPFGGPAERPWPDDPDAWPDQVLDGDVAGGYEGATTRVDPRPLATGVPPEDVGAAVDPAFESLVVVSPTYETATYLVCSLDVHGDGDEVVLARPDADPASVRARFVAIKSQLSAAVAEGRLDEAAARATLRQALAARADPVDPDDASFLRGG